MQVRFGFTEKKQFLQVRVRLPGFKLFVIDIHFCGTFGQVSTKVSVISMIKNQSTRVGYSTDF